MALIGGHHEPRVGHAERFEDPIAHHRPDRITRRPGQQHPEDLGGGVVEPLRAGLVHERERTERSDPAVDVVSAGRPGRAADAVELELGLRPLDRQRVRWGQDRAEPEPGAEEVLHRDRALRGHGVVELGVEGAQHAAVGELGEQVVDGLVQADDPLLDQRHRGDRGDRLGERRDAEDGRPVERGRIVERRRADRLDAHVVAPCDEVGEPGHLARVDVPGHRVVQRRRSVGRQHGGAHRQLLRLVPQSRPRSRPELIAIGRG